MEIRWTKSAIKHRISHQRSGHVVRTTDTIIRLPAPEDSALEDDRLVFLGPDPNGVMLEVIAIEIPDGLVIIHAMKIRREYQPFVEEKTDARTHRKACRTKRTDGDKPRRARSARHRDGPEGSRGTRYTHLKVRNAHH